MKIEVSREEDAAFAVVDIDTHWRHKATKEDVRWKGRVCKIYTKRSTGEWKFIFQTGATIQKLLLIKHLLEVYNR